MLAYMHIYNGRMQFDILQKLAASRLPFPPPSHCIECFFLVLTSAQHISIMYFCNIETRWGVWQAEEASLFLRMHRQAQSGRDLPLSAASLEELVSVRAKVRQRLTSYTKKKNITDPTVFFLCKLEITIIFSLGQGRTTPSL